MSKYTDIGVERTGHVGTIEIRRPPLNFFVYPYVEVDGLPLPEERVRRRFTYRDIGADQQ